MGTTLVLKVRHMFKYHAESGPSIGFTKQKDSEKLDCKGASVGIYPDNTFSITQKK